MSAWQVRIEIKWSIQEHRGGQSAKVHWQIGSRKRNVSGGGAALVSGTSKNKHKGLEPEIVCKNANGTRLEWHTHNIPTHKLKHKYKQNIHVRTHTHLHLHPTTPKNPATPFPYTHFIHFTSRPIHLG